MAGKREPIIARLLTILDTVVGAALRNQSVTSETRRPIALLFDSDEQTDDGDPVRNRPSHAPRRVEMTPEIFVLLGAKTATIGTVMNATLDAVVKAVLTDAELISILGTSGSMSYDGMLSSLAQGRVRDANLSIGFTFRYMLVPGDL